ncbi:MAG TPA: hypothetical protein VJ836_02640 [Candidatus Saccharimonadales bacterium]|nr:hypothetical protein [Candidatus Saccharimonadales bacterium]
MQDAYVDQVAQTAKNVCETTKDHLQASNTSISLPLLGEGMRQILSQERIARLLETDRLFGSKTRARIYSNLGICQGGPIEFVAHFTCQNPTPLRTYVQGLSVGPKGAIEKIIATLPTPKRSGGYVALRPNALQIAQTIIPSQVKIEAQALDAAFMHWRSLPAFARWRYRHLRRRAPGEPRTHKAYN